MFKITLDCWHLLEIENENKSNIQDQGSAGSCLQDLERGIDANQRKGGEKSSITKKRDKNDRIDENFAFAKEDGEYREAL